MQSAKGGKAVTDVNLVDEGIVLNGGLPDPEELPVSAIDMGRIGPGLGVKLLYPNADTVCPAYSPPALPTPATLVNVRAIASRASG